MLRDQAAGEDVVAWRRRELKRAGWSDYSARLLAPRCDVDLHRACRLLRDGCPPRTALRILL